TKLTLPGSLNVSYSYNALGQLLSLTDWSSQATQYGYDGLGRLLSMQRSNSVNSTYAYDVASRLTSLTHVNGANTLASFTYSVDARGNRTGVVEVQATNPSGSDTHNLQYTYDALARLSRSVHKTGGTLGSG